MRKLWCSIWRAFLNAFTDTVDGVAYAVDTLSPPILNLLSGVGDVAGGVIGDVGGALSQVFNSSPLLWVGLGVFAFMLLKDKKEDVPQNRELPRMRDDREDIPLNREVLRVRDDSVNRPFNKEAIWT